MPATPTPSVIGGGENTLLQQVGSALAAFLQHVVLLDAASEKVIWYSSGFARAFPALSENARLSDFMAVFDGLNQCRACSEKGEETPRTVSIVLHGDIRFFEALMVDLEGGTIALKLEDASARTNAIQRYLEDRERLFSTSRTISVSEMATTLAHELNQPIGTVTNLLSGMRLRLSGDKRHHPEVLAAIDQAVDQARFASKIITRIRDYTHSRKPVNEPIDLGGLVCSSVSLLDWVIVREGIDLQMSFGKQPLMIAADETMLQQVFVNLMRNAIEAMRETHRASRRLRIAAYRDHGEVEVTIADNGVGLTPEAENNLFVPFVSTKPTGMGVGLNICRSFVELHQGKLWLSTNEEGGCTSHVMLPLVSEKEKM